MELAEPLVAPVALLLAVLVVQPAVPAVPWAEQAAQRVAQAEPEATRQTCTTIWYRPSSGG